MSDIIVNTVYGKLRGKLGCNINGGTFYSFQGIPYAKPPLGELRFKAPQPPEKWNNIRDALQDSSQCYQRHMVYQTLVGSEDCLYLNIYTPSIPQVSDKKAYPVMLFLHGGAFTGGSGNSEQYGPELLLTEDVVLVTMNYRIGILGFLAIDDPELGAPGNAGLKDVILALKWIQENIQNFHGDNNNVTVFGESAGGVIAHLLMVSPLSPGLFHKAIAQSGCALNDWSVIKSCTEELCSILGCQSKNTEEILKFLQGLSIEKLYHGQELLQLKYGIRKVRPIGPVIEPDHPGAFLTEDPLKMLSEGRYYHVPLVVGYNNREGIFFDMVGKRMNKEMMVTDFETAIPPSFHLEAGSTKTKECAEAIKEFYYGNEEVSIHNKDKYYQLETDVIFLWALYNSVKVHQNILKTPIYMYRFSVDGKLNYFKIIGQSKAKGAGHGDELGYMFKTFCTPNEIDVSTIEGKTIYRLVKFWTNFAKRGDPNPTDCDDLLNVVWKPIEQNKMNFLDIGDELTFDVDPEAERMAFWEDLYNKIQ